jgi:hypothetical protein
MTEQNRHLFGFLGTGKYKQCTYTSEAFTSPRVTFAQTASALTICNESGEDPGELNVTIFATKEAEETHGGALVTEFAVHGLIAPDFVTIPSHFDEASVIALFEALSDNLMTDNAILSFDLTHGFRAQPAIALLVLDYIQAVNPTCRIEHLLYGAYQDGLDPVPLVDLIGLWQLRDWAAGFREFHRTGSVARLGELVQDQRNNFMRATRGKEGAPSSLTNFEKQLRRFEKLININAIPSLFGEGDRRGSIDLLVESSNNSWEGLSRQLGRFVDPLRHELEQRLSPMVSNGWSSREGLLAQVEWIEWLERHNRYQQALTVAREWATTFVISILEERGHAVTSRSEADNILNLARTGSEQRWSMTEEQEELVRLLEATIPNDFFGVCNQLELRNRINHAWMPAPHDGSPADPEKQNPSRVLTSTASVFRDALGRL